MNAVQHIAMNCRDIKAQEAFYTKHFGFRRARVFNHGTPGEFVMLRLGSMCIELFKNPNAGSATGAEQAIGFRHLAFEVKDIEKSVATLQNDGVKVGNVIDCSSIEPGLRVCFFQDPEGNWLELMEGWKDQAKPPKA